MKTAMLVVSLMICGGTILAEDQAYPRAKLLVAPESLAQPEVAKQFIILDVRERAKYDQGHVPNAQWIDHADWAKAFGDGEDTKGWSKRIADLGIDRDSKIVVYDANMSKDAARCWWILRYWGVEDARLLNGGWPGWAKKSLPVQKESPLPLQSTAFVARPVTERLATKAQLLESLTTKKLQIVDARSASEFCGDEKLAKRAGAIPGAKHLEWSDLLDKDTQQFKSAGEMRKLFAAAGIALDRPSATHCQSGGRASVMAFGMELMGAIDVSNYYRSWNEWGNADDTPIQPGDSKK